MLRVVDGGLAPIPWQALDPAMVQEIQRESSGYTLDVLKDRPPPRDTVETTPEGNGYVVSEAVAPDSPCHVSNPDVVSECGLSNPTPFALMTRLSLTPSSCRRAWRKWRTPSTVLKQIAGGASSLGFSFTHPKKSFQTYTLPNAHPLSHP